MRLRDTYRLLNGSEGFSLIEILVATTIASIIMVMVYSSYHTILQSIKRSTGEAEFYENLNLAIAKIDQDLSSAYYNKDNKNISFICEVEADNSRLNFVTVNHNDLNIGGDPNKARPETDIREVGYYLKTDKETMDLYYLMKREDIYFDEEPEEGGSENIILENVAGLKFEFRQGNNWTDKWDSRQNRRFPRAVRTTLTIKNYQKKDEVFQFITILNIRKVL